MRPDANPDRVGKPLKDELPELMAGVPGMVSAPVYEGVDSATDRCMMLTFSYDVQRTRQLPANRELNSRIKQLFERYGIEVPDAATGDAPKEA